MMEESPLGMHCHEDPSHGGLVYIWYLMQARRLEDCEQSMDSAAEGRVWWSGERRRFRTAIG